MPKIVDHVNRRGEICGAAMRILARGGPSALTLRSLAKELNGSITLVTHFFSNRDDLFEAITDDLLLAYDHDHSWERVGDPSGSLRGLIEWLVPMEQDDDEREASRVALISMRDQSKGIDHFYVAMEERVRGMLAHAVNEVVPSELVPTATDYLRAAINGLVLSIVEHPKYWTLERRESVIDVLHFSVLHLAPATDVNIGR